MTTHAEYQPGPAAGMKVDKDGEKWTLVVTRELRHPPARVWQALTDPAHLKEWAWYEVEGNLGQTSTLVKLTAGGPPSETTVKRAEAPKLLEFNLGPQEIRFELEPNGAGTTLKIHHLIAKPYIAMGAAGWHVSLDMLERALAGEPLGRMANTMQHPGWQRLLGEYSQQFGIEMPKWGKQ